jgi:hypothetical protein
MRKIAVLVFLVTVLSSLLFGQAGFRIKTRSASELYAEQRRVVGTWSRQDFEGLRLSDAGWDRFKPVTSFKKNPEFTSIVVVSRFQVEPRDNMSWDMDVTYTILGRYELGAGYLPDPGMQTVTFHTKDIDGDILIVNVDPGAPHVSKKAAIEWMKRQLQTTASDVEKIHLNDALKFLELSAASTTEPSK